MICFLVFRLWLLLVSLIAGCNPLPHPTYYLYPALDDRGEGGTTEGGSAESSD